MAAKLVPTADGDVGTKLPAMAPAGATRGTSPSGLGSRNPARSISTGDLLSGLALRARLIGERRSLPARRIGTTSCVASSRRAGRESTELVRTLTGHENWVNALAVLDAHRVVSASRDHTLKVWDLDSGHALQTLAGHGDGVNAVAVLDKRRVVSASGDHTLKVWDLDSGHALKTLVGHGGGINAVAVLDQGRVVSASNDRTLKMWDLDSGHAIQTFAGHGGGINVVAAAQTSAAAWCRPRTTTP